LPNSTYPDEQQLLLNVLRIARGGFTNALDEIRQAAIAENRKDNGILRHDAWILSMYRAFTAAYRTDPRRITVFAKPLKDQAFPIGEKVPYGRGEYGFDLAVVEMRTEQAPYRKVRGVPGAVDVVARYLWQVESEIGNSAAKLSEDLGKLTGGAAPSKLLVTLLPNTKDDGVEWLHFIEKAAQGLSGQLYVAMVRSYAGKSGGEVWRDGMPEIRVFRRQPGGPAIEPLGSS
jgi:hypothetical protein